MEPNKILSANILDLIFDDRNKEYGAYELRITYPERVKRSLIIVFIITAVAITGAALGKSFVPVNRDKRDITVYTFNEIEPEKKEPILPPEPKKTEAVQAKTIMLTDQFKIVPEDVDPLAKQEDFKSAGIGLIPIDGPEDVDIPKQKIDNGTGIIEKKKVVYDVPVSIVEIDAKFTGNWEKFLIKNLNANVPTDNGAPAGVYKVIIKFVVDLEGNVSEITALTSNGYGMEEEAIRVLRKAIKWEPAFQNGHHVKAYRIQPITFAITEEQ